MVADTPQKPVTSQKPDAQHLAGFPAEIVDVNKKAKTGMYGEVYSVACRILEGNDAGRIIRRNLIGPVKKGDIVRLPDTSREAREIRVK